MSLLNAEMITQAELREVHDFRRRAREMEERIARLRERVLNGVSIEPGVYSAWAVENGSSRWSMKAVREAVGRKEAERIFRRLPRKTCWHLRVDGPAPDPPQPNGRGVRIRPRLSRRPADVWDGLGIPGFGSGSSSGLFEDP